MGPLNRAYALDSIVRACGFIPVVSSSHTSVKSYSIDLVIIIVKFLTSLRLTLSLNSFLSCVVILVSYQVQIIIYFITCSVMLFFIFTLSCILCTSQV